MATSTVPLTIFRAAAIILLAIGSECKPCGQDPKTGRQTACSWYFYDCMVFMAILLPVLCGYKFSKDQSHCKPVLAIRNAYKSLLYFIRALRKICRGHDVIDRMCSYEESHSMVSISDGYPKTTKLKMHRRSSSYPESCLSMGNVSAFSFPASPPSSKYSASVESISSGFRFYDRNLRNGYSSHESLYQHNVRPVNILGLEVTNLSSCSDFSLTSSASGTSSGPVEITSFSAGVSLLSINTLQKSSPVGVQNITSMYITSALTQTDGGRHGVETVHPRPVFSASWQGAESFQSAGGSLTMTDSDVRLEIPANALPPAVYVDVVMATYTDLPPIRQVLSLTQNYVIMSPVAEFHASGIQQFDRPVHIFLPHGLPLSFPEEQVRIYHLHRGQDGALQVSLVPFKALWEELCKNNDTHFQSDTGLTRDEETGLQYGPGYFQLLPCGELIVTTVRFCAYVCVACGQGVDQLPELHLMAVSPPLQRVDSLWQAEVFLYLWDRKITIRDFQRDHVVRVGVAVDKTLDLVDDFLTSLVTMEMTLRGADRDVWQQVKREDSQELLFPTSQQFPLKKLLHCQARESPKKKQWLVESVRHQDTSPTLQCYIDVTNVSTSQPAEQYRETLFIRNTGNAITQSQVGPESRNADETRKKLNTDRPNNTRADTSRRPIHTAALSVQPVALVSNTLPEAQEHNSDVDTRLLYGSGPSAEGQSQLGPSENDPRQALLPQNRNSPTNIQSYVRIDNLKQHIFSLFPRRQGQEHDEYGERLCPMTASCPDLHLSASVRRDQTGLTVHGTSGRELMRQQRQREPLPRETRSQGVGDQAEGRSQREDTEMGDVGTAPMTSDVRQQDPRQVSDGSQHGDHASMASQQQSVHVSLHRAAHPPGEGQGGTTADLTVPTWMSTGGALVLPDNSLGVVCVPSPTPSHERPALFDDGTTR